MIRYLLFLLFSKIICLSTSQSLYFSDNQHISSYDITGSYIFSKLILSSSYTGISFSYNSFSNYNSYSFSRNQYSYKSMNSNEYSSDIPLSFSIYDYDESSFNKNIESSSTQQIIDINEKVIVAIDLTITGETVLTFVLEKQNIFLDTISTVMNIIKDDIKISSIKDIVITNNTIRKLLESTYLNIILNIQVNKNNIENMVSTFANSVNNGEFIQMLKLQGLDIQVQINEISVINNDGTSNPINIINDDDNITNDDNSADDNKSTDGNQKYKKDKSNKNAIIVSVTIIGGLVFLTFYIKKIKINKVRAEKINESIISAVP